MRVSTFLTSTWCCCCGRQQSATLFTQQLGRGLRRARGKSSLTVIDLIGQQHREFRFEDRLRAILDPRRGQDPRPGRAGVSVPASRLHRRSRPPEPGDHPREPAVGGPSLPVGDPGCRLAVASRTASASLSSSTKHDHRLEDVYKSGRSWTSLSAMPATQLLPHPTSNSSARRSGRSPPYAYR